MAATAQAVAGGVGPTLANTKLTADAFVSQLRHPRGIMPPFHERIVSDSEARAILAYLQSVPPPPPKLRADVPKGVLDQKTCAACHRKLNPIVVAQFESSAMGKPGRQNPRVAFPTAEMTCAACHGTNHDEIRLEGSIPFARFASMAQSLPKNKEIIFYCA